MFGVTRMTLGNWKALLNLDPKLLNKVDSGKVPVVVGYQLGKLKPEDQAGALDKLLEEAGEGEETSGKALKGQRGRKAAAKAAKGDAQAVSAKLPVSALKDLFARLEGSVEEPFEDSYQELAYGLLAVILGDDPTGKTLAGFPSVHKVVKRVIKEARAE